MGSMPQEPQFDVLIIGAGLSGICSLYHVRKKFPSWRIKLLDNAPDVGGTWYWNRYPGCRLDSETLAYSYSFDKELLEEWDWKNTYAPRDETYNYIRRVAEKHDLYKDIQFNTHIKSAQWNDDDHTWTFVDAEGQEYTTRFFLSCVGFLSAPTLPAINGVHDFQGQSFHTSRWPKDFDITRDLKNKRVGVIGTGATGIQISTAISQEPSIQSLKVFQRTANWSAPLRNTPITAQEMAEHKQNYSALFARCAETSSGFIHSADPRKTQDVSDADRLALYEKLYAEPGFAKWLAIFSDTYTSRSANDLYSSFMASKIRSRVTDPLIADSLIPTTHGFGTRRVPLESGYFEAFNQPNISLVDLRKSPISHITATGISQQNGTHHALDTLIYATGFDAITGAFSAINFTGTHARPLISSAPNAVWRHHRPCTFLGLTVPAMPNMFMVLGPHQPFGNATRSIEHAVHVIVSLLAHMDEAGYSRVEPTQKAADAWTQHVAECSEGQLVNEVDSWMTGVNGNVEGKTERCVARYAGSVVEYRRRCEEVREKGWEGLVFGK